MSDATTQPSPETDRYREVARLLYQPTRPLRVLAAVRWPLSVREEFLAGGADRQPDVAYGSFDAKPCLDACTRPDGTSIPAR